MYKLEKCLSGYWFGYWEVKHYWDDGVTVQCRYFKTLEEAKDYLNGKGN